MTVKYTILFPKGSITNRDYYVKAHMPLIATLYPGTFLKWEAASLPADAPFELVCRVEWTTAEAFESLSSTQAGKQIFADVPNFATQPPIFMKEEPLGGSP